MTGLRAAVAVLLLCVTLGYAEGSDHEFLIGLRENVRLYNSSEFTGYGNILDSRDRAVNHVDYHLAKNLAFIATDSHIFSSQLKPGDTSTVKTLLSFNETTVALAVDWAHDKLYYVLKIDDYKSSLNVMDLDGNNVKHLLDITNEKYFSIIRMKVDPYEGKLFWSRFTKRGHGVVESCDLTGANLHTIGDLTAAGHEIFVDVAAKRIYYTLAHEAVPAFNWDEYYTLHSMDYNGGEKQDHFYNQEMYYLFGLYYHDGYVYWGNSQHGNRIYKLPVNEPTSNIPKRLPTDFGNYFVMHFNLVHPDFQKQP